MLSAPSWSLPILKIASAVRSARFRLSMQDKKDEDEDKERSAQLSSSINGSVASIKDKGWSDARRQLSCWPQC